jgi:hypothetical protein
VSLYASLAAALLWAGSVGGAFWYGIGVGDDKVTAQIAREDRLAEKVSEATATAAAKAIADIKVTNTTIRQTLEKEVHERTVFRDCSSGPDSVRMLNSSPAIAARPVPPGASELSASGATR